MSVSRLEDATLSVLLDIRNPLAYLALPPALAMANELGIEIDWLPVVAPPLRRPSAPGPEDDRGIRHRRHRAEAIAREVEVYAAAQGLVLENPYRDADPTAANLGWLWMRGHHPGRLEGFLLDVFRDSWKQRLDPSSEAAIAARVETAGGNREHFLAWCAEEGAGAAAELADELEARGLSRTPCYVLGDEVFVGRQHLPMIRWILGGRARPGPI